MGVVATGKKQSMIQQQQQQQQQQERITYKKAELVAELDEHNDFFDMIVDMFPSSGGALSSSSSSSSFIVGKTSNRRQNNTKDTKRRTREDEEDSTREAEDHRKNKYFKKSSEPAPQKIARLQQSKSSTASTAKSDSKASTELPQTKRRKLESSTTEASPKGSPNQRTGRPQADPSSDKQDEPETKTTPEDVKIRNKSRIENLRAKLLAKISMKQSGRPQRPDQVSKRAARRDEKRRRQEQAKNRLNKKSSSSATLRQSESSNSLIVGYGSGSTAVSPAQDLAQVDFGRLTGLNPKSTIDPATARSREILQELTKPKNLHKMLKDAEAKRQKLQELKQQQENSEAKAKLEAIQWKDTFKEADGTRVKDDPAKLKSALKRKAAKKAKSQKAWQSRAEQLANSAKERHDIRQHNLNARKQGGKVGSNLSRKEIRTPTTATTSTAGEKTTGGDHNTTGRGSKPRAGFEGRKRDFLNKEKKNKTHQ